MLPGWGIVKAVVGLAEAELSPTLRHRLERFRPIFERVGRDMGVDPALLAAVARWESAFDPNAVGPELGDGTHARGLMQVIDSNLQAMGISDRWRDPETNIRAGAQILLDFGVHDREIGQVLEDYGGWVTKDGSKYVNKIVVLWARMRWREGVGA